MSGQDLSSNFEPSQTSLRSPPRVFITSLTHPARDISLSYARHGSRFIGLGDPDESFGNLAHDLIAAATPTDQDVNPDTAPAVVLVKLDFNDESEDDVRRAAKFLRIGMKNGSEGEGEAEVFLDVIVDVRSDGIGSARRRRQLIEKYLMSLLGDGTSTAGLRTLVNVIVTDDQGGQLKEGDRVSGSKNESTDGKLRLLEYTVVMRQSLLQETGGSKTIGEVVAWLTCKRRDSLAGKVFDYEELHEEYVRSKQA